MTLLLLEVAHKHPQETCRKCLVPEIDGRSLLNHPHGVSPVAPRWQAARHYRVPMDSKSRSLPATRGACCV
jgi:hypothetical protein